MSSQWQRFAKPWRFGDRHRSSFITQELVHRHSFATRTEAYDAIADYIDNFYNAVRRHSAIGYCSPVDHETRALAAVAA